MKRFSHDLRKIAALKVATDKPIDEGNIASPFDHSQSAATFVLTCASVSDT